MNKSKFLFTIVLFSVIELFANDFRDQFNMYGFSLDFSRYFKNLFTDSVNVFYSQLANTYEKNQHNSLRLKTSRQDINIKADFYSLFFEENNISKNSFNLALGTNLRFEMPLLQAGFSFYTYTANQTNRVEPNEIEFCRYLNTYNEHITGFIHFNFELPQAWLKFNHKGFSLLSGKTIKRWGPGYKGTLSLSGANRSPYYLYYIDQSISDIFNLSAFCSYYDDIRLFKKELYNNDTLMVKGIDSDNLLKGELFNIAQLPPRFCSGQRLDFRFGKNVQIGLYELSFFFGGDDFLKFFNPLQIYYLSNANGSNSGNLMGGIDFNIKLFKRLRIYGDFLNDDITIFEKIGNPNKYALQFGAEYYPASEKVLSVGLEYTHVSPYTYGHFAVLTRSTYWDKPVTWPHGNDMDLFHSHALFSINPKLGLSLECNYWLKGKGSIKDDWYADTTPNLDNAPYWPQNMEKYLSFILNLQYRPTDWATVSTFYNPATIGDSFTHKICIFLTVTYPFKRHFFIL